MELLHMTVVRGDGNLPLSLCRPVELLLQQYRVVKVLRDSDIDGATAHDSRKGVWQPRPLAVQTCRTIATAVPGSREEVPRWQDRDPSLVRCLRGDSCYARRHIMLKYHEGPRNAKLMLSI